jgi:hypothetical protein
LSSFVSLLSNGLLASRSLRSHRCLIHFRSEIK